MMRCSDSETGSSPPVPSRWRTRSANRFTYDSLAFSKDDVARHAHHRGIVRYVAKHHRSGANPAIAPHRNVAQNLRASTDHYVVEKGRVPLPQFLAGSTKRHTLVERDVLTDNGGLADHHAHTVIDKEPTADFRAGMDLDGGEKASDLRQPARQQKEPVIPQPVIHAIKP